MSSRAVHRGLVLALTLGFGGVGCFVSSATLAGCGGDDDDTTPGADASTDAAKAATATDAAPFLDARAPSLDGSSDAADASDASTVDAAAPAHVLVVSGSTDSVLSSVAIGSGAIEGTTAFSGGFGAVVNGGSAPFLLEQYVNVVARLDVTSPWKIDSTWNVLGTDMPDGGGSYTDPGAVLVSAGTKAYVLRYTRNIIDVIDPSQTVDGGAPTGNGIDLSSLVQAGDTDGIVEMTAGYYDASTKRLWVVLENIDRLTYPLPCSTTKATVIAIDTTTDTLVSLGGSGPGGAYAFTLTDPNLGTGGNGVVFDSANKRVIAAMAGCQDYTGSVASGTVVNAGIEAVSLTDGTSTVLLAGSAFTSGGTSGSEIALVGGGDAVVGWYDPNSYATTGYLVDLTAKTVKSTLAVTPNAFVSDGAGHLFGTSLAADGGTNQDVIEVDVTDGSTRVVASSVITDPNAYVGGITLW